MRLLHVHPRRSCMWGRCAAACASCETASTSITEIYALLQVLDAGPEQGAEEEHLAVMDTHARLVVMRHKIFENPTEDLDDWAKKLRQANFKQQYKRRQETTPFQCLPYKPTPEQQAKLLQDIDARRRQHAMSNARQHSSGQWPDNTASLPDLPRTSAVSAPRQVQPEAETTCSSEEENDDDERAEHGRSRSRSGRADAMQAIRRTARRPQRPRRFADTEMYDDDDPDYAPPGTEQTLGGPGGMDSSMRGGPLRHDSGLSLPPFGAPGISGEREMLTVSAAKKGVHGAGQVRADTTMTDDFLPQAIPRFAFPGVAGVQGKQRSVPGLPQHHTGLGDGYLPSAAFMQRGDGAAYDWSARHARHSGQNQMHMHHAYVPGVGFGAMHPQRSMAGGMNDAMAIGSLSQHSVFPQHSRTMHAQHQMSMPMMAGHSQQYSHAPVAFPQDTATTGGSQRMDTLPEDSSMHAGLDALLHASTFASPFHSGRMASARTSTPAFPEDPYAQEADRRRRASGHGIRVDGMNGAAGGSAADYNVSGAMMHQFPGHQRQLQQMGHLIGLQGAGLGQGMGQARDGQGMSDMPARMRAVRSQLTGMHGSDAWNGLGGGM